MRSIVINKKHGGFGLSDEAILLYAQKSGLNLVKMGRNFYQNGIQDDEHFFYVRSIPRDDPYLVEVVHELGKKADNTPLSELKVVDIPSDIEWTIEEYDGAEWVAEKHRTWR